MALRGFGSQSVASTFKGFTMYGSIVWSQRRLQYDSASPAVETSVSTTYVATAAAPSSPPSHHHPRRRSNRRSFADKSTLIVDVSTSNSSDRGVGSTAVNNGGVASRHESAFVECREDKSSSHSGCPSAASRSTLPSSSSDADFQNILEFRAKKGLRYRSIFSWSFVNRLTSPWASSQSTDEGVVAFLSTSNTRGGSGGEARSSILQKRPQLPVASRLFLRLLGYPLTSWPVEQFLTVFGIAVGGSVLPITLYTRRSTAAAAAIGVPLGGDRADKSSHSGPSTKDGGSDDHVQDVSAQTGICGGSSGPTIGRGLLAHCHPSLFIADSAIHGRGVFTRTALAKGTRIMTIPEIHFVDGVNYTLLLGGDDTKKRLPETVHYTLATGRLRELVLCGHARHLLNHRCDGTAAVQPTQPTSSASNVVTGLSRKFWPPPAVTEAAALSSLGESHRFNQSLAVLRDRCDTFECFDDPNSYFVSRDVAAGEELTLNYHAHYAPFALYPNSSSPPSSSSTSDTTSDIGAWQRWMVKQRRGWKWIHGLVRSPITSNSTTSDTSSSSAAHTVLRVVEVTCNCGSPQCRGSLTQLNRDVVGNVNVKDHVEVFQRFGADIDEVTLHSLLPPAALPAFLKQSLRAAATPPVVVNATDDGMGRLQQEQGETCTPTTTEVPPADRHSSSQNSDSAGMMTPLESSTFCKYHIMQYYRHVFQSLDAQE